MCKELSAVMQAKMSVILYKRCQRFFLLLVFGDGGCTFGFKGGWSLPSNLVACKIQ